MSLTSSYLNTRAVTHVPSHPLTSPPDPHSAGDFTHPELTVRVLVDRGVFLHLSIPLGRVLPRIRPRRSTTRVGGSGLTPHRVGPPTREGPPERGSPTTSLGKDGTTVYGTPSTSTVGPSRTTSPSSSVSTASGHTRSTADRCVLVHSPVTPEVCGAVTPTSLGRDSGGYPCVVRSVEGFPGICTEGPPHRPRSPCPRWSMEDPT